MRGLLLVVLNLALVLAAGGGWLAAMKSGASLSAEQRARLSGQLDALISGWDAAKAPPAARRLVVLVCGDPDGDLLDPPQPQPPWAPVLSWLRRGSLRVEHERRLAALVEKSAVLDWYEQGRVWGDERRRRLDALTLTLTKARGAQARVIVVVDGRGAALASAAIARAPVQSGADLAVDRLISVGAEGFPDSPRVGEILAFWRSEGDAVTPAGTQAQLRDSRGRVLRQTLEGQSASADGVAALVRGLVESDEPAGDFLRRAGQTLAPPPTLSASSEAETGKPGAPRAPKPAAAAKTEVGAAGLPGGPAIARPAPLAASIPAGWTAEHVDGPDGDIGWTVAGPTQELARKFSGHGCAEEADLAKVSKDSVPSGCHVLVCLAFYLNKPLQRLVIQKEPDPNVTRRIFDGGSEGALMSKVLNGTQFGFSSFIFIKTRPAEDRWPAKDMYHYAVEGKNDLLIDLRYEVFGPDPASCGRPFFDIYDKAAHSIAPERLVQ